MSTRSGDLDPGLGWYLARTEQVTAKQFHEMVNHESGLLGVSETSSDMRELLGAGEGGCPRGGGGGTVLLPSEEMDWRIRRGAGRIGHAGFFGRHRRECPAMRARICDGLEFLGIELDEEQNAANERRHFAAARPRRRAGDPHG